MLARLVPLLLLGACGDRALRLPDEEAVLTEDEAADGCTLVGDRVVCNHGHSINFRAENLHERRLLAQANGFEDPDESLLLATDRDGLLGTGMPDPLTPVLRASLGEVVRLRVVSFGDQYHTFHVHGHVWADEAGTIIDNVDMLPAEVHEATFVAGGGPDAADDTERGGPGDWMYHCHVQTHMTSGMWSLLRVMEDGDPDLDLATDGRYPIETPPALGGDGETIDVWVVAIDARVTVARSFTSVGNRLADVTRPAWVYVPVEEGVWDAGDAEAIRDGVDPDTFQPWVLSLALGTTVRVHLKNLIEGDDGEDVPVSLHPHGVVYSVDDDGGTPQSVIPARGGTQDYEYLADTPRVWPYHDHANPHHNVPRGLFASIVVHDPDDPVAVDRDYVVVMNDMDFAFVNGLGEGGGGGGHQH